MELSNLFSPFHERIIQTDLSIYWKYLTLKNDLFTNRYFSHKLLRTFKGELSDFNVLTELQHIFTISGLFVIMLLCVTSEDLKYSERVAGVLF